MLTSEQHEARSRGLGGSDTATILNLNPYKSAYELWQEKSGRVVPEDISDKFPIIRGNDMEALVAKWFTDETGLVVRRDNRTLTNPDHPYMLGHIDRRLQGIPEGLECKTANWRMAVKFGDDGTDDVPPYYLIQCMHYMIVTGWKVWHLAADIGGDFKIYRIEYDETLANHIAAKVNKWWTDHIVNDIEPTPETHREIDVAYRVGDDDAQIVEASDDLEKIHASLEIAIEERKAAEKKESGLKYQIKAAMGDACALYHDGRRLATWNNQSRKGFDAKSLERDNPEVYETFKTMSEFRVLRPKFK